MADETGNPAPGSETVTPTPTAPAPSPSAPTWRDTFSDPALKADPSLAKFKDVESLAKSYKAMESYQGRSVAIPAADAKPEDVKAFYGKLGVPESADKYEMKAPEGAEFDPAITSDFKGLAHNLHLTQAQMSGLVSWFAASPIGNAEQATQKLGELADRELRGEWGGAFDMNMAFAKRAAKEIGGSQIHELLDKTGLGNHPAMIRFFHKLGKEYAEDGTFMRDLESGGLVTSDVAKSKISEIMADKGHAYHKGERGAVDAMRKLFETAYPSS